MLNVQDKFILSGCIYRNRLLHWHLFPLKLYGMVLFDDQSKLWLHNVRGIFNAITFIIFNISEVSINYKTMGSSHDTNIINIISRIVASRLLISSQ